MDATSWPQEGFQDTNRVKSKEETIIFPIDTSTTSTSTTTCTRTKVLEKKAATRPQEQLNCPRCNSTNTKFCYYNNYSLTQPRYLCKTCRRYWTEGGSLRNVPVGGGSRKNKRSSSSIISMTSTVPVDLNPPSHFAQFSQNPNYNISSSNKEEVHEDHHQGQALSLSFPPTFDESHALELVRSGIASRGLSSIIAAPTTDSNLVLYSSSGFNTFQELKPPPTFGFAVDNRHVEEDHYGSGRLLFRPVGDHQLKQHVSSNIGDGDHKHQENNAWQESSTTTSSGGYNWNGMLRGGINW